MMKRLALAAGLVGVLLATAFGQAQKASSGSTKDVIYATADKATFKQAPARGV